MRFNCNKTVLVLSTIGLFASGVASATGSSSGCNVNTGCDSWTNASVYDLTTSEQNYQLYENIDPTNSTVVVNGVSISITAWSDTAGGNDDIVTSASFSGPWGEGFGVTNQDEANFDNHSDSHAIDNMGNWSDYDMVLFSFSESVSLAGATFNWLGGSTSTQQVSVAGLSDINQLTSGSATWSQIAGNLDSSLKGSFQIGGSNGTYHSDFTTTGTSQYWLVGAYNSLFAYVDGFSENNDAFKLTSIGFNQVEDNNGEPDPVNAPSSFALLLLAGGFAAWRKKQAK